MSTQHPAVVTAAVRERSSSADALVQTLRTHPLEILLFGVSIVLLLAFVR